MKIRFRVWVVIVSFILSACGISPTPDPFVLTPPAIHVNLTKEGCLVIEIQPGMQIAWTTLDEVDRLLLLARVDEQGVVVESGGTPLLQPGETFAITLTDEGQYTYYCSTDRQKFGTITANSTQESTMTPCVENLVSPVITGIQPPQPSAGSEVTVMGSGGFIQDSCGGVNESARSFPLYLDNESAADLQCYVDHCETKLCLPDTLVEGVHCLSAQKDVCEFKVRVTG